MSKVLSGSKRRRKVGLILLQLVSIGSCISGVGAQVKSEEAPLPATVLFKNVRIFDGKSTSLSGPSNVLVRGNKIERITASSDASTEQPQGLSIDGNGRTLMPGLIDAHWHAIMAPAPLATMMVADVGYLNLLAANESKKTLMRGFTSVRDLAGPSFSLKKAIDEELAVGPRIWPSGAMISQTGGHGDFRMPYEVPGAVGAGLSRGEQVGGGVIADGVEQVTKRAREQLMLGASQLKLAAGGGVSSNYDPIDVSQYTEEEFKAAVVAAENWGTYVTVHAYTPRAIQAALRAGVKCIDHAQLLDDETAKMIAKSGAWLSLQPFVDNEYANPQAGDRREKQLLVFAGTDRAYSLAKKYGIKTAWGTDMLFDPAMTKHQGAILATMTRWYTPAEALRMATSVNAELLSLSGARSPYQGKLGVVEEGALADLLLVDGNPLENLNIVADPDNNFVVIMKDGKLYKDVVSR